jgi:hypothetical protein
VLAPLLAAAVLSSTPACTVPALAPRGLAWKAGETLGYSVEVIGVVQAGSLSLSVERPMFKGTMLPLRARVKPSEALARMKGLQSVAAMSWLATRPLRADRYREELVEGGVHKSNDVHFPPEGTTELALEWQSGEKKGKVSFPREGPAFDLLSAAYYLRSVELQPGQELCFDLVAAFRLWRVRATVVAEPERVETDAGIFRTLRVDAVATRADKPSAKRPIHVWISDDNRHIPVAMVSEVDLGPIKAQLTWMKGTLPTTAAE